ncbi:MAG: type II toxin-antitoxin system VapC family toxin [Chloroflexota bacterium]|nr:type II toxin-antitoxin system VapC family toxin [Chloroflexota bacterium]MDE2885600.1 type II toxin-antitoxin system VapC family toxin [Chloroflexota bacterium]
MILDASAVVAILFRESDAHRYEEAIAAAPYCRMSVVNFVEAAMVLESRDGPARGVSLDVFMETAHVEMTPVTPEHAYAARQAWRRFGKGNHPAGLNFGDCFAYALAQTSGESLLFKGGDFALTDVEDALAQQ